MNDQIVEFLNANFHKVHKNPSIWTSYTEFYEDPEYPSGVLTELTKIHSHKTLAHVKIYYWGLDESMKIELYLNSYNEWESFFEGYIKSVHDLQFIIDCIGIPYNV